MKSKVTLGALLRHEWIIGGRSTAGVLVCQVLLLLMELGVWVAPFSASRWAGGGMLRTFVVLAGAVLGVSAFVVLAVLLNTNYKHSVHGKYAYFTSSIPVRMRAHYGVKVVTAWIALMASSVLVALIVVSSIMNLDPHVFGATETYGDLFAAIHNNSLLVGMFVVICVWLMLMLVVMAAFVETFSASPWFQRSFRSVWKALSIVIVIGVAMIVTWFLSVVIPCELHIDRGGVALDFVGFFSDRYGISGSSSVIVASVGTILSWLVLVCGFAGVSVHLLERKLSL